MPYIFKFLALKIVIWKYKFLLRIIINHLKRYTCLQANEYYWIKIQTRNHILDAGPVMIQITSK